MNVQKITIENFNQVSEGEACDFLEKAIFDKATGFDIDIGILGINFGSHDGKRFIHINDNYGRHWIGNITE